MFDYRRADARAGENIFLVSLPPCLIWTKVLSYHERQAGVPLSVIVKGIGHPLIEKGKCHHYEKGDIERERTETVVGLQ